MCILFVCVGSFVFWGVAVLAVGLVWLIGGHLDHLCGGFAVFIRGLLDVCLFRDEPARYTPYAQDAFNAIIAETQQKVDLYDQAATLIFKLRTIKQVEDSQTSTRLKPLGFWDVPPKLILRGDQRPRIEVESSVDHLVEFLLCSNRIQLPQGD